MRAAVVTPFYPWPADTGGKLRSYYLLKGLAAVAEVDLYTVCYGEPPPTTALAAFCRSVQVTPLYPYPHRIQMMKNLLSAEPRSVRYFHDQRSPALISQQLEAPYDLLVCDEICMFTYFRHLYNHAHTPRVSIRHKVDHLHYQETAQSRPWGQQRLLDHLEARRLAVYERAAMPTFHGAVVCSTEDGAVVAQQGRNLALSVIVNGADVDYFVPNRAPDPKPTILLMGTMYYQPNIDGVLYFFNTIYPSLKAALPDLQVLIVGHSPAPEVVRLGDQSGVTVTGSVPDVRPYLARSWLLAVPLRLGGGTRLKIVEALASGVPVVSTTIGAQGLDHLGADVLAIADTPADFIAATLQLLGNAEERQVRGLAGRPLVEQYYSWHVLGQEYAAFCQTIVQSVGQRDAKPAVRGPR